MRRKSNYGMYIWTQFLAIIAFVIYSCTSCSGQDDESFIRGNSGDEERDTKYLSDSINCADRLLYFYSDTMGSTWVLKGVDRFIPVLDAYLVGSMYYDGELYYKLISKTTCGEVEIPGIPIISPKKSFFVALTEENDGNFVDNKIMICSIGQEYPMISALNINNRIPYVKVRAMFEEYTPGYMIEFKGWQSDTHFILRMLKDSSSLGEYTPFVERHYTYVNDLWNIESIDLMKAKMGENDSPLIISEEDDDGW